MSADLERKIGELTGHLDALVPTLERMERRLDDIQTRQARTETNLTHMKTEVDAIHQDFRESFQRLASVERETGTATAEIVNLKGALPELASKSWVRDIKKDVDQCARKGDVSRLEGQIAGCASQTDVDQLKKDKASTAAKWWDIAKLLIAAVLGGAMTVIAKGLLGGG